MRSSLAACLLIILLLCSRAFSQSGPVPDSATAELVEKWLTLKDAKRHFHLDYPPSWKANTAVVPVAHYSMVFAALDSAGKEKFTVREVQTAADTWSLNADLITQQVPVGTAYIDISWLEAPVARFGPSIHEEEAADLSGVLKESKQSQTGALISREIGFSKWGRQWRVTVYMHAPVAAALREEVDKVLASFRFDGVPAGDEVWAIGRALKSLPAEADPEKYTREGGSSEYYCAAKPRGDDVIVTFTKHVGNTPQKSWTFRVTATGEVLAAPMEKEAK